MKTTSTASTIPGKNNRTFWVYYCIWIKSLSQCRNLNSKNLLSRHVLYDVPIEPSGASELIH